MMQQIIVSGVSRGLGAAMFEYLMGGAVAPIGIARHIPDAVRAAEVRGQCKLMECDLSVPGDVLKLDFGSCVERDASSLVFISNAGIVEPVSLVGSIDEARLIESFMVNAVAPAIIANKLAALSAVNGSTLKVINIGSGAANHPIAGWSAYCAGKAAAQMFFQCLAAEPTGVAAETIDPGVLDTGMQQAIRSTPPRDFPDRDEFIRLKDEGQLQDPAMVARDILRSQGLI